jgi:hypothetical protein
MVVNPHKKCRRQHFYKGDGMLGCYRGSEGPEGPIVIIVEAIQCKLD